MNKYDVVLVTGVTLTIEEIEKVALEFEQIPNSAANFMTMLVFTHTDGRETRMMSNAALTWTKWPAGN